MRGKEGHAEKLSLATPAIWQHGAAEYSPPALMCQLGE